MLIKSFLYNGRNIENTWGFILHIEPLRSEAHFKFKIASTEAQSFLKATHCLEKISFETLMNQTGIQKNKKTIHDIVQEFKVENIS